ncbi:MAG TPA: HEAT repeat domain-containing protein [Kofleriaceae bacterium]|nr:HEAT repeat domain-containing protein [Kofleriaceae bacterium]
MEAIAFLEALVRALGRGWAARYGLIAPYGVFGLTLSSDAGGSVEVVPSLVRGDIVIWSPFVFVRGTPHYDLHIDGRLVRTSVVAEAVERLERWRAARGPVNRVASRLAKAGDRRGRVARTTELDLPRLAVGGDGARKQRPVESLADALRDQKLGRIERARKLAKQRGHDQAARELLAIARRATGDARANALGVLVAVIRPEDGPELARYLDDPERSVQSVAIDGVKRSGYAAAIPALATLVLGRDARPNSSKSRLAASAATAMKALSGKRGAAALTSYLTWDDPRVREAACVALTMFASPGKLARPLLERLLDDGDARVARAARRALAAL